MAEIRHYPFISHLRSDPTTWVQHQHDGKVRRAAAGQSFWFQPRTAALAEVPLEDREQTVLFHARTSDFQDVTVASTITFRVEDPALAVTRTDFAISPRSGAWRSAPLETLGGLLSELAQQPAVELIGAMDLQQALAHGIGPMRTTVAAALADDARLRERGLVVTDVRVVSVRTDPDVERALQVQTRERIQTEADKATYERRALAVERESAIAENELASKIEIARREEVLVTQRGRNEQLEAETTATARRTVGQGEADAQAALLAAYDAVARETLLALAVKDVAANLPQIESLTVTPDVLTEALARLTGGGRS